MVSLAQLEVLLTCTRIFGCNVDQRQDCTADHASEQEIIAQSTKMNQ